MTSGPDPRIWLLDLEQLRPALERAEQRMCLLAEDERGDGAMGSGVIGLNRRAVRIALRLLLLHEGAGEAALGPLLLGPAGKPSLAGTDIEFSVSHAGQHALIAVSRHGPVGVDLECWREVHIHEPRRSQIVAAAAAVAYQAEDGRPIRGALEQAQVLVAWTRLEAWAKARGSGIGVLLTDLGLVGPGSRAVFLEAAAESARRLAALDGVAVADLCLPTGLFGAVAARAGAPMRPALTCLTEKDCAPAPR
ncbi:MAG TPA: hypothetical protein VNK52_05425 [Hyphomicrobiaceae bacterium]|nr:hypothetical protein [Hyphomicrobiaceae bacterium]